MKHRLLRFVLLVLLPATGALGTSQAASRDAREELSMESAHRFGRLTGILLRDQMDRLATAMALAAPLWSDPDTTSPVVRAALAGDTVAALGTQRDTLYLFVALAESPGDPAPPAIRFDGRPLPPTYLSAVRKGAGYQGALYLRGSRVAADPSTFGPASISVDPPAGGGPGSNGYLPERAALVPVAGEGSGSMPAHILMAPGNPPAREDPRGWTWWIFFLGGAVGGGALLLGRVSWRGGGEENRRRTAPVALGGLAAFALPVGLMWVGVSDAGHQLREWAEDHGRQEMVRVLGVLKGWEVDMDPGRIADATGFDATHFRGGEERSSLPPGPTLREVREIPAPDSPLPALGVLELEEGLVRYVASVDDTGLLLVLTTHPGRENRADQRILPMAGAAGLASLLGMGFLLWEVSRRGSLPSPGGRGERKGREHETS